MPQSLTVDVDRQYDVDPPKSYPWHNETKRYLDGHTKTKYGHERDSRRQNFYDAESLLARKTDMKRFPWEDPGVSLKEVAEFIEGIASRAWWQRRYDVTTFELHDGRGMKNPRGGRRGLLGMNYATLKLPRKARTKLVVLHEMTHGIMPSGEPHAHHGRLFAARFLELIGYVFGDEYADVMKECYREENVKWHPHNTVQV